jgi:hypothetical protein
MIRADEIEAVRVPGAFRIPRAEAMRLSRERIEAEAGRTVRDRELERLTDEVLTVNRELGATPRCAFLVQHPRSSVADLPADGRQRRATRTGFGRRPAQRSR